MTLFNSLFGQPGFSGRRTAEDEARAARQPIGGGAFGQQAAMPNINSSLLREIHKLQVDNNNLHYKICELEHRLETPPDEETKKLRATNKKLLERINYNENKDG